jgi:hypothetical protein
LRNHQILIFFLIVCLFISSSQAQFSIKRISLIQAGAYYGSYILCCDSDHNGLNEIIIRTGTIYATDPLRWEVWEHRPMNRYELVFSDTGAYPNPPGITTGNFRPYDVGDIDRDSLTDLVGPNVDKPLNSDTIYYVATTQESPDYLFYPQYLSWWFRHSNNFIGEGGAAYYFPTDLDNDGNREIIKGSSNPQYGLMVFENVTNNNNILVYNDNTRDGFNFAFGDFDMDGYQEFVTATLSTLGLVDLRENIGDNQYQLIWTDTVYRPNGSDVFSGQDLDGDGKPEFFVAFYSYPSAMNYLYMWEATGNNTYQKTLIDQVSGGDWSDKRSLCGDIDGDDIEEIVWSIGGRVMVYKAIANNQFQRVWEWINDHGGQYPTAIVNIYDMNKNSYNEIVISGNGKTSIFEVEAVRLSRPNGGEVFQDSTQEHIRWQKFYPPRCDSLSLFYSTDNGRTYESIVHSLQSTDTSYLWTVPSVNSDSCKIKIIAYGPGWQYDESDGNFSIASTGINEIASLPLAMTLGVNIFPNPVKSMSVIRYTLPIEGKVSLQLYDISGRLVKTLVNEIKKSGNYSVTLNSRTMSAGVYFLSLTTESKRIIERIVIIK